MSIDEGHSGVSRDKRRVSKDTVSPVRGRISVDLGCPLLYPTSSGGITGTTAHKSTLGRVTGALGLEGAERREYGDGWKEFQSGELLGVDD